MVGSGLPPLVIQIGHRLVSPACPHPGRLHEYFFLPASDDAKGRRRGSQRRVASEQGRGASKALAEAVGFAAPRGLDQGQTQGKVSEWHSLPSTTNAWRAILALAALRHSGEFAMRRTFVVESADHAQSVATLPTRCPDSCASSMMCVVATHRGEGHSTDMRRFDLRSRIHARLPTIRNRIKRIKIRLLDISRPSRPNLNRDWSSAALAPTEAKGPCEQVSPYVPEDDHPQEAFTLP